MEWARIEPLATQNLKSGFWTNSSNELAMGFSLGTVMYDFNVLL